MPKPHSYLSSFFKALGKLNLPDIPPNKAVDMAAPQQTGDHPLGIAFFDLRQLEIGADDKRETLHHSGIEQMVDGGLGELRLKLRSQIIQYQKITSAAQLQRIGLTPFSLKMFLLNLGQ